MKLYEIEEAIRNFEFQIDEETGEILNESELDELNVEKEKKIESICCLIKEYRAESKAILEEIGKMRKRADRLDKKADSLESWLKRILDGKPFETPKTKVTWRASTAVDIIDENLIPDEFCEYRTTRKPVKDAIKKALKAGQTIIGAKLIENNNMSVR